MNIKKPITTTLKKTMRIPFARIISLNLFDILLRFYFDHSKYKNNDPWDTMSDYEKKRTKTIVNLLNNRKYKHCLDVGCADGSITVRLKNFCTKITAIDISKKIIDRAIRTYKEENIDFKVLNIRTGILEDMYDLIIVSEVLYYLGETIPEKEFIKALDKLNHHLMVGGRILVSNYLRRSERTGRFIIEDRKLYIGYFNKLGLVTEVEKEVIGVKGNLNHKAIITVLKKV